MDWRKKSVTGEKQTESVPLCFQRYRNKTYPGVHDDQKQCQKKQNPSKMVSHDDVIMLGNENKQSNQTIKKKHFGFKYLEELCDKDPAEIVFVISDKNNGFMDLFKLNKNPDWLFLLVNVTAKICSTELVQSKTLILSEFTSHAFLDHLKAYILSTPTEKVTNRCMYMNLFFENCLKVFKSITTLFPKTAVERLKDVLVSFGIAINGVKKYCNNIKVNESLESEIDELLKVLNEIVLIRESKSGNKDNLLNDNLQFLPPPENFRELTIYPTAIDLEDEKPFLRPNISKGAFRNVEHYLDVQFRLLREDFIGPLREAIKLYREVGNDDRKKKIDNIRIYRDVEFKETGVFVQDKLGFIVHFDKTMASKVNWETSKRFIYGSLVLFTANEFQNFFLGVVLERDVGHLKEGKLIVELLNEARPVYNTTMTMVESEVFFEPYKCSMEVLKKINSQNFPMKKYIVSACKEIGHPRYLDTLRIETYRIEGLSNFNVLDDVEWPVKEELGLDEMQYNAFKAALTNEFTVIQGPPGTGKTYIGLKIMKTIIDNLYYSYKSGSDFDYEPTDEIRDYLKRPVVVVCYTNHALDQFIEGVLDFTENVVRIGNQSKSDKLNNYSLKNMTRNYRSSTTVSSGIKNTRYQVKTTMNELKYLRKCSEDVLHNMGVLELSLLKNGMPVNYHGFFNTSLDLLTWLFQDYAYFYLDPILFLNTLNHDIINEVYHSDKMLEINSIENEDVDEDLWYGTDDDSNVERIVVYCLLTDDIKNACNECFNEFSCLEKLVQSDVSRYNDYEEAKFKFKMMKMIYDYLLEMFKLADVDCTDLPTTVHDINVLGMRQRWKLYFSWLKSTKEMFGPKIVKHEKIYTRLHKQYLEMKELEYVELMSRMHVIALTTTGAAKHRIMLEGLQSPIVLVEEAAEVLEAHIVSSLTSHCQHLILIGDHKQLRPSNAVYKLAKYFNLDVSLFERMVNNDIPCYTLQEQHRMRPEIASLIAPTIYPELKNHISVHDKESVRGVVKDLFFLNHNVFENEVEELSSKINEHEASFLIMFARHLLLQGYNTDQITILTTYKGQMFHLRSLQNQYPLLTGMRVVVVDNYQGEESDIVLLSLVRSNETGKVGFLKTENRICVALSRAKCGLYVIGNMDNLYDSGDMWKKIKETLIDQDSYGDKLTLECTVHSGVTTKVSKSEDFNVITEGGCTMLCKSLLKCGHYCMSICHSYDREHTDFKCKEPCNRSCDYNHPCTKTCFMDCGKCTVSVWKDLPCGHGLQLPCFVDPFTFPCEEQVEVILDECKHKIIKTCSDKEPNCTYKCFDRLECGHSCERNCHKNDDPDHILYKCLKPCENINENCSLNHKCQKLCHEECSLCTVKIEKKLICGHIKNGVPCGLDEKDIKCYFSCDRILPCDHKCQVKCWQKCAPCNEPVKKIIPECGHPLEIKCQLEPHRKHCTYNCEKTLSCGHKCKSACAQECTSENCDELVQINTKKIDRLACGHSKIRVLCRDRDKDFSMDSQYLLDKCQEPCLKKLSCDDICSGTCGECKQGRLHVPCDKTCNKINPCNHVCQSPCKFRCPPCYKKCSYSCVHSKCARICGEPCALCQEKCEWQCPHLKCTKKCGEVCNRKPCYEPCNSVLQCGHECIGFCGEPCPPLCRVCHRDEVMTIIFGNEDEPDARFVYLEDCKHSVESKALENWISLTDENISLKQCPLCKTPILKTQRFMNHIKLVLKDIAVIKQKQYGELAVINCNKNRILKSLTSLNNKFSDSICVLDRYQYNEIKSLWSSFCDPLLKLSKKSSLPSKDVESLDYVIKLFKSVIKYKKQIADVQGTNKNDVVNHFIWLLSVAFKYARQLSNQQKTDINAELSRGIRLRCFYEINSSPEFKAIKSKRAKSSSEIELLDMVEEMRELVISCAKYTLLADERVQALTESIKQKIKDLSIITEHERRQIHEAMSVDFPNGSRSQGHWCKCKNGHIYCVTECGGPMEKALCPECKVEIGGTNHRYVTGTTVASEMDGAKRLAWTAQQNMENYLFDDQF